MIIQDQPFEIAISAKEIDHMVERLAIEIDQAYAGQDFVLIGVLNGSFMFVSDLAKKLTAQPSIHFIKYTSYQGSQSTGHVAKELDVSINLTEKHVLIVEDIVDTGTTLVQIVKDIQSKNPATLKIASLLLKPKVYDKGIAIDFVGKEIPNDFVIGYGMDIDGHGRGLKDIYVKVST